MIRRYLEFLPPFSLTVGDLPKSISGGGAGGLRYGKSHPQIVKVSMVAVVVAVVVVIVVVLLLVMLVATANSRPERLMEQLLMMKKRKRFGEHQVFSPRG